MLPPIYFFGLIRLLPSTIVFAAHIHIAGSTRPLVVGDLLISLPLVAAGPSTLLRGPRLLSRLGYCICVGDF